MYLRTLCRRRSPFRTTTKKTTLDSQWEDEASTTVEQGEVADKIRSLGVEPRRTITGSNGSIVEEPTIDDRGVDAASVITPLATPPARLVITAGNDVGVEMEVRSGKTYTIGRGLDNDLVLTDIAVSRKHFDVRNEDGAWIILDRGSGNGTVVNGNLEDNPFMLANGDVIEIGNTAFRFDYDGPEVRARRSAGFSVDDEEMSTVAGKQLNHLLVDEPPTELPPRQTRPKTMPPPTPLRPLGVGQAPPMQPPPPFQPQYQPALAQTMVPPASTLPLPQMANRPPVAGPHSPTMLHAEPVPPIYLPGVSPTTIPGQGAPVGAPMAPTMMPMPMQQMHQMHPMYGYPQATEIPPHSVHQLIVQSQNRRGDHSTAHVPPTPYGGLMPASSAARQVPRPPMSRRAKYALGGAALTIFAGVATMLIIRSAGKSKAQAANASKQDPKQAKVADTTPRPIAPVPKDPPKPIVAKQDPPKQDPPKQDVAKADPPKQDPPKQDPPKPDAVAKADPPKPDPKQDPRLVKADPPKQDPKPDPKPDPKLAKADPKPKTDPKKTAKADPKPDTKQARRPPPEPKVEPKEPKEPKQKKTAVADVDGAKEKADALYREKKFSDASRLLDSAAKGADADDAKQLKLKSQWYAALGKAFFSGMAQGTQATVAFENLRTASTYDSKVGNAFESEIAQKLTQVAPKAAIGYIAVGKLAEAHTAVTLAGSAGADDNNVKAVRQKLESEAGKIYQEAMKERDSNPDSAKTKFQSILGIIDKKSPLYAKAQKALSGS